MEVLVRSLQFAYVLESHSREMACRSLEIARCCCQNHGASKRKKSMNETTLPIYGEVSCQSINRKLLFGFAVLIITFLCAWLCFKLYPIVMNTQRRSLFFSHIIGECELEVGLKGDFAVHVPEYVVDPYTYDRIAVCFEEQPVWYPEDWEQSASFNPLDSSQEFREKWDSSSYWKCNACKMRYLSMNNHPQCPSCTSRRYYKLSAEVYRVTKK